MVLQTTAAQAATSLKTVQVHGQSYTVRQYIGTAPTRGTYVEGNEANDNALPQGFLVYQPPDSLTPAHFHEHDQFQVFITGSARVGKKNANPLSVQFAGAHSPYGPIVAGEEGVEYFTLRKRWDPGAKYMPAMRDALIRGYQRQLLAAELDLSRPDLNLTATATNTAVDTDSTCVDVIGPEPDGLLVCIIRLGPQQTYTALDPALGDGQYHVVLEGSALTDGEEELSTLSCEFVFPDEPPCLVQAGDAGLTLLVLRFPKSTRPV